MKMRLINVDDLLKELEEWNADLQSDSILYSLPTTERQLGITDAIVIACWMPTVDAIPIEWIGSQVDKGKWTELVQRWAERKEG